MDRRSTCYPKCKEAWEKKGTERYLHLSFLIWFCYSLPSISSRLPRQQPVIIKDKLLTDRRRKKFQKEKPLSKGLMDEHLLPNNVRIYHLIRIRKSKKKMFSAHDI